MTPAADRARGGDAPDPAARRAAAPAGRAPGLADRRAAAPAGRAPGPADRPAPWSAPLRRTVDRLLGDARADGRRIAASTSALGQALGHALGARALPFVHAARATPRAARIAREAAQLLAEYRLDAARARLLSPEGAGAERAALDRRAAARVHRLCVELRGAVLKLGQFASTRRDLLPPAWAAELALLQDSVPPVPFERVAARIEEELGAPLTALFAAIDPAPIAAASLAQVHAAVLPDGTRVAVKVQVPGVEAEVEGDLSLFSLLARAARDLLPAVDLQAVAGELGRSVREELDYRLEAARARRMAADLAADPSTLVPRVHDSLSTARVLTMDLVDGERLTDFLDRAATADRAALDGVLAALVRVHAHQILALGRFQADPHPGNFLVCAGPRLALLDFGSIAELTDAERGAYAALTAAVIARDRPGAAALLARLGFELRDTDDPTALIDFADLLLDAFRPAPDRPLADLDPRAAFDQALAAGRESPVRVPRHFVQVGRVLASLAGLLLAYRPSIALWPLVAPVLIAAGAGPAPG